MYEVHLIRVVNWKRAKKNTKILFLALTCSDRIDVVMNVNAPNEGVGGNTDRK